MSVSREQKISVSTFHDNALSLVEANNVSVLDTRLLTYCSSSFMVGIHANQPFSIYASIHPYAELRSSTMAKRFLQQLPKIPLGELPADSSCMICLNAYGAQSAENGIVESPIRLPCTHHVGLECITLWLSANRTAKTSCPYCRKDFFPAQPRSYMSIEGLREIDEEVAERMALLGIETRRARIGGPALRNYEGNDNMDPSLALVINAFALLTFGIVLIIILKFLL